MALLDRGYFGASAVLGLKGQMSLAYDDLKSFLKHAKVDCSQTRLKPSNIYHDGAVCMNLKAYNSRCITEWLATRLRSLQAVYINDEDFQLTLQCT